MWSTTRRFLTSPGASIIGNFLIYLQKLNLDSHCLSSSGVLTKPSSPSCRTTFLDEFAFRRVPFFLVLAHFSLCLPLIFNLLMQSCVSSIDRPSQGVKTLKNNAITLYYNDSYHTYGGAQWLSGRVLDSRPKGRGFEPHRRHCVVVLEQDTFILA